MSGDIETATPRAFAPADTPQLIEAVRTALAEGDGLELAGNATKRGFGHPVRTARRLDLSAFSGIRLYEPEELVMTAGPATPLSEIVAVLAEQRQQLAFEPRDMGPLWGGPADAGTIGGVFSCNLSGPRRIKAGAARDHLLGAKAVSGHGAAFKTGGRVVKNVTGYDLCKVLAGSFGTLAALSEVTFKVLPAAERVCTLLIFGLDDTAAGRVLVEAASSPFDPSGLAHLPPGIGGAGTLSSLVGAGTGTGITAIRLEGPEPSVAARLAGLKAAFRLKGDMSELGDARSAHLWREIADVAPFRDPATVLWRLSVPPAAGPLVVERLCAAGVTAARWYYDWGGGLIWLELKGEPQAEAVRAALGADGGHATLIRARAGGREDAAVFQPVSQAEAALTRRLKESFDPQNLFNPGRLGPGLAGSRSGGDGSGVNEEPR